MHGFLEWGIQLHAIFFKLYFKCTDLEVFNLNPRIFAVKIRFTIIFEDSRLLQKKNRNTRLTLSLLIIISLKSLFKKVFPHSHKIKRKRDNRF